MRNLHKFIEDNYGLEALYILWEWEQWEIMDSDYKNHSRFISKDLIPVSVRLKLQSSSSRSRRAKEIIHQTEKTVISG